jgi:hypothetical protein
MKFARRTRSPAPVPLFPQPLGQRDADRHRSGVVDLRQLDRLRVVLPHLLSVAEQPERHDRHVDVAVAEGLVQHRGMRRGVERVELHSGHRGAGGTQVGHGLVQPRRLPGGQYDPQRATLGVLARHRKPDLRRPAEQQQRLGVTNSVNHSDNLLDMSEAKTPCGSTDARTLRHSSSRG